MYKLGKYKYESIEAYQRLLKTTFSVFLICTFFLIFLKEDMSLILFNFTFYLAILMMLHLALRFAKSKKWLKNYIFNEY